MTDRELLEASLQPKNHGPAVRWALIDVNYVVVDMIYAAESQATLIAESRQQRAIGLDRETVCEIGWLFIDDQFKPVGDEP